MLVDDDENIRFIVRMILEMEGYSVVEAGSGEECLEKFNTVRPDLILLDITMAGINGWEVCRQIKERKSAIPAVLMLSARNGEEDIKRSLEYAHADAHIKKPFDTKELLDMVKILLQKESHARHPK
ncbi:response regulator with CheY-like receiver domain and winged-helix DNA-binding domain [Candidatus Methanoperedens nitroreducens]|uniref:Response regulator with CheY-like receiver domain and winged-helix DNA-binding domain n=2 Tax=Candidatus Methanoperedens nitratireducens TaxID=1392998 RepID=A0A062VAN6_9EURY|nr:response regulator with CheY-like receiver domain and winged-helix DNA-binding domain [Candidatus Methanoperedens nitroreducens]